MSAVEQPSGTVTLVFTDIEGSTRLLEELGVDAFRDALAVHRRIVRDACARFDGYEVDYEGDAFFYAFATAQSAVSAVGEAMAGLDGGPIRIRVGIHTGEPALDPPKYVGIDVHRAARIMSAAHGGQVVVSPTTVSLLVPGSDELRDLGEHRLKDLSSAVRLHQLTIDGLPGDFPPLKTLYRSNLPVPATTFIGRDAEVRGVAAILKDPVTRLLTLTGPGGMGKTRLALQAAAEAADDYPGGIFWVPLAAVSHPELLIPAIAAALEITERHGELLTATIAETFRTRALLLLDNIEQLLPAAADAVAELVACAPALCFLITSRERLMIAAERVWDVPPMSDGDGKQLFVDRARAVGVELGDDDDVVGELCRRVDQLPLAIQLAAARTRSLSPAAILERLDQRLPVLVSRARDSDERQRTLEATIGWSYDLLDAEGQRVLRALSVFRGGFSEAAATAVADAELDVLESLLDKSLIGHRVDGLGRDRYWMLETIREFAGRELEARGEDEAVARAHVEYFAGVLVRLWRGVRDQDADATKAWEADLDNGRFALQTALEAGDSSAAACLLSVVELLFFRRGARQEAVAAAERYLALDRSGLDPGIRIEGDNRAAEILRFTGDEVRGLALKRSCVELSTRFPDAYVPGNRSAASIQVAALLSNISDLEAGMGNLHEAHTSASRALELRRDAGEPRGIAHGLAGLAFVEHMSEEYEQAALHLVEAADLMEACDSPEVHTYRIAQAETELILGRPSSAARLLVEHLGADPIAAVALDLWNGLMVAMGALSALGLHSEALRVDATARQIAADAGFVSPPGSDGHFERARISSRAGAPDPGVDAVPLSPAEAVDLSCRVLAAAVDAT